MFYRHKGTLALVGAALVLVAYIAFLLVTNYLSHQELVKSAIEQIRQDMTKRAAAVSYFAAERINDLKAIAAGRELAFFFANKALGMSMKYGLSANIEEIESSFDRLLQEKRIGQDPIYTRIDFLSDDENLNVTRSNPNAPTVGEHEFWSSLGPVGAEAKISIHQASVGPMMIFSLPYSYKNQYMGEIISWLDLHTVYRYLIQATDGLSPTAFHVGYHEQYLPLPTGVSPVVANADLPVPGSMPPSIPCFFQRTETDGVVVDMVAIKVPVDNTPLFLTAVIPYGEIAPQRDPWRAFLFLGLLSVFVLAGIGFLLRIKDQNLILNIRLDESTKRQEAITQKNAELKREIADRKEVERALRASEGKYRKLHQSMRDGFVSFSTTGRIIECNAACLEMLGYEEYEIAGLTHAMITPEPWVGNEAEIIENQVLVRGYSDIYEKEYRRRDGTTFPAELRTYSLVDESGSIVGTWSILRDVAERKHTEEELKNAKETAESANRTKSEFLASMSHELRTPLHQVNGFIELVAMDADAVLSDKHRRYLQLCTQSSQHLLSLINDILDLTKVEAGKVILQPGNVNLTSLLEESIVMVREKARKNHIEISLNTADIPATLVADERILRQILYNLLANATKFTGDGGCIEVSTQSAHWVNGCLVSADGKRVSLSPEREVDSALSRAEYVKVSVCDTGVGLRQEDLERIFKPFEQVRSSSARRLEGTGLGLALTREFVELHGGHIWAESDGLGKGSAFHFILPTPSLPPPGTDPAAV